MNNILFRTRVSEEGLIVTGAAGITEGAVLTIPASIDGIPVIAVGFAAFYGCPAAAVILEEGIRRVEGYAFAKCTRLKELQLPDSLADIDAFAFNGCEALSSLVLPRGLNNVSQEAFSWCRGLKTIHFACENAVLGERAFYFCSGLCAPVVLSGILRVLKGAFSACMSLPQVVIPGCVEMIETNAFQDCYGLTDVVFEEGAGSGRFRESTSGKVPEDRGLPALGLLDDVFSDCRSLRMIRLPDRLKRMGIGTFRDCQKLTAVELPKDLEVLPEWTFSNCRSLRSVVLPAGIHVISRFSFHKCHALQEVKIPGTNVHIRANAFTECISLKSLDLSQVQEIDPHAFSYCDMLESLTIPSSFRVLKPGSFYHCPALSSLRVERDHGEPILLPYEPAALKWLKKMKEHPDWEAYDMLFSHLRRFSSHRDVALWRLRHGPAPAPEIKDAYLSYLRKMSHCILTEAVEKDDLEAIGQMGENGLIRKDHCEEYIRTASANGAGCLSYLIHYRQSRFGRERKRYLL